LRGLLPGMIGGEKPLLAIGYAVKITHKTTLSPGEAGQLLSSNLQILQLPVEKQARINRTESYTW